MRVDPAAMVATARKLEYLGQALERLEAEMAAVHLDDVWCSEDAPCDRCGPLAARAKEIEAEASALVPKWTIFPARVMAFVRWLVTFE